MGLTWAAVEAGNVHSILFLTCAIICGYVYQVKVSVSIRFILDLYKMESNNTKSINLLFQCPPFRLSYQGLGEPLCFAAFGPFATTAFYLLQGSSR